MCSPHSARARLRVRAAGWSGNPLVATGFTDQLVREEGLVLDRAYAYTSCAPSRASLLTGRDPMRSGVAYDDPSNSAAWGPPPEMTLLPMKLKEAGYACHFAGKWDAGFIETRLTRAAPSSTHHPCTHLSSLHIPARRTRRHRKRLYNSD